MEDGKIINTQFSLKKLAEGAKPNSSGEYAVVCPLCRKRHEDEGVPYSKKKLYIAKDFGTSYCFVCHTVFMDKSRKAEEEEKKKALTVRDLEKFVPSEKPPEFKEMAYEFETHPDAESKAYLTSRSPYYSLDEMLKDGFRPDAGKIIINYMLGGRKFFYQVRYLHPRDGRKYFLPPTDFKPVYFAKGEFNPFRPTIITEGAFSSYCLKLAVPEYNVIAVQGSSMTSNQIRQLEDLGGIMSPTYIFLDETDLSRSLMAKLRKSRRFGKIAVLRNSSGMDPEELSRKYDKDEYRERVLREISRSGQAA